MFAFVAWAVVAGSVMFWALRLFVASPAMPAHAVSVGDSGAVVGDVARLLGSTPKEANAAEAAAPVSELSTRLKLTGVMAPKSSAKSASNQGVALISVDGKPPRAFSVGSRIEGDSTLQAVSLRTASIGTGPGKAPVVLEMPPLAAPNTGSLPPVMGAQAMGGFPAPGTATAGGAAGSGTNAVPATMGIAPRGLPFNPASQAGKPQDGMQQVPTPQAPPATMQGSQFSAQ